MGLARVVELTVGDEPEAWEVAGFAVDGGVCALGDVRVLLTGDGGAITGWTVVHPDLDPGPVDLDGLATAVVTDHPPITTTSHANGTVGLDHVVVSTPDIDRTTAAFATVGVEPRRTRDTTAGDAPLRQRFFRMGTIVEVIGPPEPDPAAGPARFWGIAVVSADLDQTAEVLAGRLGRIKDAVQPGRRIVTLRTRELGISVPVAFMTPHRA